MKQIKDFFSISSTINEALNETGKQDLVYLEVLKVLSKMTCNTIYVIDYQKKTFEYVSNNPLFLCGHSAKAVKKMGYDFYLKCVLEEDLDIILKINTIGFDFYNNISISKKKNILFHVIFILRIKKGI